MLPIGVVKHDVLRYLAQCYRKSMNSMFDHLNIANRHRDCCHTVLSVMLKNVQGDQKVSVHLMITVQKTRKNILNSFSHHDNVVLY
jgi:hypothetical protein